MRDMNRARIRGGGQMDQNLKIPMPLQSIKVSNFKMCA